ncbi:chromosome segregation protein SMC [Enterococcus sp. LJL98]
MYLKRIEIAGFKSFADRTVIDFEEDITAIVGPNGSGKSNITEAIRWVLGEQSVKSLRGGKMPDIIFAGSDSRKALNLAEVTIVLANEDHYLPLDYSEVSVTRRISRSGDSDYYLNKQACRLRDIQELFMDSGLGKESFSIISQGKVEAIFSSKPEERRGIFEEAAGVLKYKQRKKKAEQKLFETEDNLNRVQDIVYELEEQLAPLARQSTDARTYLRLKETFTQLEVADIVTEILTAKAIYDRTKADLATLKHQLTQVTRKLQHSEEEIQELRQRRSLLDTELEAKNEEQLQIVEALKQAQGQREVLLERSKHTEKSTAEYQENLARLEEGLARLKQEKQQALTNLSQKNHEMQQLEKELATGTANLAQYQKTAKELIEELRGQYVDSMQQQANVRNDLKYLERQYQQEFAQNQQVVTKQAALKAELQDKEATYQDLLADLKEKQGQLDGQRTQYLQTKEKLAVSQQQFSENQSKMFQLMKELQQTKARQKSLQEIQENYSGFYQGTRTILQNRQALSGIVGAVAELVDVPREYTLALETALGNAAQNLIVETESDARQAIAYLKQKQGGRGTFLPLTTIHARQLPSTVAQQAETVAGYLGIASQLIHYEEKIAGVLGNLLGTTLIAQDLDSGNQLARKLQYRYRVVTLEGDVMHAGGSMTGGATRRGQQGSLFSQNNELQTLTKRVTQLSERLANVERQVQQFEKEVATNQTQLESLRHFGEEGKMAEQEVRNQEQHLHFEIARLKKELTVFTYENQHLEEFLTTYEEQKEQGEKAQKELAQTLTRINDEIQMLMTQEDSFEEKRQQHAQEVAHLQARLAVATEQGVHLRQQIEGFNLTIEEQEQRQAVIQQHLAHLSTDFSSHGVTEESLQAQIASFEAKKIALQSALQEIRAQRTDIQAMIHQQEQVLSQANQQQKEWLEEKTALEVENSRVNILLDNRLDYLLETYQLSFEQARATYGESQQSAAEKEQIQRLRQEMAALEPVNLQAIEQFEQVKERYDFLTGQQSDLIAAKEQLFETMSEMDEEVKSRFQTVFEGIRHEFQTVFPNMFGGGRAELILTDPTDLLHTGIEIEAQPPGKKLQNLRLLSGGERALTAIALLFSIIQVRPVPFCVLDEVEAALDEANVLRFGRYLRSFQNDTQFIVVTHRKGTMEAADILYGVTMEESGVSKLVSVRLEEIAQNGQIEKKRSKA